MSLRNYLLLALALVVAITGVAQVHVQAGLPIHYSNLVLHVQGNPINVYEFTVSI